MQQEFITVTFNRTKIAIRCADILYVIMSDEVKCRARVPFVTQESLFVNENLIL